VFLLGAAEAARTFDVMGASRPFPIGAPVPKTAPPAFACRAADHRIRVD